jgi:hypothetical protein
MVPLFQRRKEEEIVTFLPTENVKVTNRFCQLYPLIRSLRLTLRSLPPRLPTYRFRRASTAVRCDAWARLCSIPVSAGRSEDRLRFDPPSRRAPDGASALRAQKSPSPCPGTGKTTSRAHQGRKTCPAATGTGAQRMPNLYCVISGNAYLYTDKSEFI